MVYRSRQAPPRVDRCGEKAGPALKIALFLNADRGIAVLRRLVRSQEHKLVALVTPLHFKDELLQGIQLREIPHLKLADVNEPSTVHRLQSVGADVFVLAGYSAIVKAPFLAVPPMGAINLHAGRLPQYRGGSPLNWQLLNGEAEAGLSVIRVDSGIDTGAILAEGTLPIGATDTILDLHQAANSRFPDLVEQALDMVSAGRAPLREQKEDEAQYWHQRNDEDGRLNFSCLSAEEASRRVRALTRPYAGAWVSREGQNVRVFACEVPKFVLRGEPGRVCYIQSVGPYIVCKDRALRLTDYVIDLDPRLRLKHGDRLL